MAENYADQRDTNRDNFNEQEAALDEYTLEKMRRQQIEMNSDSAKIDNRLLEGDKTGTKYDKFLNMRIRSANLTEDGKISQLKIAALYNVLFFAEDLGDKAAGYRDRTHIRLMAYADISNAGDGWLIRMMKVQQAKIDRSIKNINPGFQQKAGGILDRFRPQQ